MKIYTIRITRQARKQLRGIKKYIAEVLLAPDAARNTVSAIKKELIGGTAKCHPTEEEIAGAVHFYET